MANHMTTSAMIGMLALALASGKSYRHTFATTSNFDDAFRWKDGKSPCAGDVVQFDPNKKVSVFVQTNFTVTEIVLPMDGEFVLSEGAMWGSSSDLSPCPQGGSQNKQASFLSDPNSWVNVENWMAYDVMDGSVVNSLDLLDTEKVPCEGHDVVFPSQNSWIVDIPLDVSINSLTLWGQAYASDAFAAYRASGGGSYQFQGAGRVTSYSGSCSDPTGCVCRDAKVVDDRICSELSCPPSACQAPLKPNGMCCDACGALLTMTYSSSYNENRMLQQIDKLKSDPKYSGVHAILSKIKGLDSDHIQVLVIDENTGTNYGKTAQDFAGTLYSTVSSPNNALGIITASMTSSGAGFNKQTGLTGGAIAGVVIGVLCLVGLILVAAIFINNKRQSSFSPHVKLENESKGLSNPAYDLSSFDKMSSENVDSEKKDLAISRDTSVTGLPQAKTSDFEMSFGNPLYEEEDV